MEEKSRRASHLMKSVEVRYSSSSRMDEIEPMRGDYIYWWEINFNVQLSSPCEQLDRLEFLLESCPSISVTSNNKTLSAGPDFFSPLAPVSQLASHLERSDTLTALLYMNTNEQPDEMALRASLIGQRFFLPHANRLWQEFSKSSVAVVSQVVLT